MIEISENGKQVTVRLPEEFTYRIYREFRNVYVNRSDDIIYTIDFVRVISMDSSALGMLLLMHEHCKSNRSRIRLVNCSSRVAGMLSYSSVGSMFTLG
ncbi:MAG: STAS domain-containing protein [Magnetococcales bacterium]|nr:STAS domain-containing protein [Magnetococcales bacterium]